MVYLISRPKGRCYWIINFDPHRGELEIPRKDKVSRSVNETRLTVTVGLGVKFELFNIDQIDD